MPEIDPDQAAERVKKLIIVGDNRLKEAGIDERFRPFIERRLESVDQLGPGGSYT
jgi:hypothetical protein